MILIARVGYVDLFFSHDIVKKRANILLVSKKERTVKPNKNSDLANELCMIKIIFISLATDYGDFFRAKDPVKKRLH